MWYAWFGEYFILYGRRAGPVSIPLFSSIRNLGYLPSHTSNFDLILNRFARRTLQIQKMLLKLHEIPTMELLQIQRKIKSSFDIAQPFNVNVNEYGLHWIDYTQHGIIDKNSNATSKLPHQLPHRDHICDLKHWKYFECSWHVKLSSKFGDVHFELVEIA
jgi:hypothetical protein